VDSFEPFNDTATTGNESSTSESDSNTDVETASESNVGDDDQDEDEEEGISPTPTLDPSFQSDGDDDAEIDYGDRATPSLDPSSASSASPSASEVIQVPVTVITQTALEMEIQPTPTLNDTGPSATTPDDYTEDDGGEEDNEKEEGSEREDGGTGTDEETDDYGDKEDNVDDYPETQEKLEGDGTDYVEEERSPSPPTGMDLAEEACEGHVCRNGGSCYTSVTGSVTAVFLRLCSAFVSVRTLVIQHSLKTK
jgi:hypothetical protein